MAVTNFFVGDGNILRDHHYFVVGSLNKTLWVSKHSPLGECRNNVRHPYFFVGTALSYATPTNLQWGSAISGATLLNFLTFKNFGYTLKHVIFLNYFLILSNNFSFINFSPPLRSKRRIKIPLGIFYPPPAPHTLCVCGGGRRTKNSPPGPFNGPGGEFYNSFFI